LKRAALICLLAAGLPFAALAQKPLPASAATQKAAERGGAAERDYREALAAIGQGHLRVAEQKLNHALSIAPQDDDARLTLGQLMIDDGRRSDALRLMLEGMVRNPGRFGLPIARLQFEDGQYTAVLDTLSKMPRHEGGNPWRDALFGAAARELEMYPEAVEAFQRALAVDRSNAIWSVALADCLLMLGRADEARTVLQQAGARSDVTPDQRQLIGERIAELSDRH